MTRIREPLYLRGNHPFLNFYHAPFYLPTPLRPAGVRFATVEHYFQAIKAFYVLNDDLDRVEEWFNYVNDDPDPYKAKHRGQEVPLDLNFWNQARFGVMFQGQSAKFFAHTKLREELMATDGWELVEQRRDPVWGYPGRNLCGQCLMRVREIFITGPE